MNVHVNIDKELKHGADAVLKGIGLSTTEFIRMALIKVKETGELPFERFETGARRVGRPRKEICHG